MRKQIVLIATLLCVALSGYAQMVVKGTANGILYQVDILSGTATVLGAVGSPAELTVPAKVSAIKVTEFAMNPGAVGQTMSLPMISSVTSIADGAFATLTTLTAVKMEAPAPPTLNGTFTSTFPAGVTIKVGSEDAKTAYETAGWLNVVVAVEVPVVEASGNCGEQGDNLQWAYANGKLTITGSGRMADFTFDNTTWSAVTPWKDYRFQIKKLDLPEGMTYIGRYAFWGLDGLKEVVLPEGLIETSDYSFSNCQGLKSFTFPTTLQTVGDGMFSNNYALREIIANGLVPANMKNNVPNINARLIDVYVQEGYIPVYEDAWGTDFYVFHNPKDMCGANLRWKYNASTHALTIYKFDETQPATMYNFQNISDYPEFFNTPDAPWYQYHDEIASISLPEGLTNIGTMAFVNCSTVVAEVVIPSTVIYIENLAFGYCHSIPRAIIPEGVQHIGEKAFISCSSLDTINIPAGVSTIKESTFEYCSSLPYLYLPATVQTIERNAFNKCINLVRIDVESEIPATIASDDNLGGAYGAMSSGQRVFCREYSDGGEVDIEVYIPSGTRAAYEQAWGIETAVDALGMHQIQCRLNYHDPADQGGDETDIESVQQSAICVQKVLNNGQLFIQRGENIYSLDGKKL